MGCVICLVDGGVRWVCGIWVIYWDEDFFVIWLCLCVVSVNWEGVLCCVCVLFVFCVFLWVFCVFCLGVLLWLFCYNYCDVMMDLKVFELDFFGLIVDFYCFDGCWVCVFCVNGVWVFWWWLLSMSGSNCLDVCVKFNDLIVYGWWWFGMCIDWIKFGVVDCFRNWSGICCVDWLWLSLVFVFWILFDWVVGYWVFDCVWWKGVFGYWFGSDWGEC